MSAKIVIRLGLLVAIVAAGLAYIIFGVLQVRVGTQAYDVSVNLDRAGGLFPGSYVAYRGVDVGRVDRLSLQADGVVAHLSINPGTRIPVASTAAVRDLSAVGEQYVNFTPTATATPAAGPWLHQGSVVGSAATTVPITIESLLSDTGGFTNSIDTTAFSQLLDTATTALQGTGPELRTLLDNTEHLFSTLESVQPQTNGLIDSGQTLLRTAAATNPAVANFSTNLAQLTAQLDISNTDLQAVLANGASATSRVQSLLAADTSSLIALTGHAATVANVAASNTPAVTALLDILPVVLANFAAATPDGTIHAHFFLNDNQSSPVCTYANAPFAEPTAHSVAVDLSRTCNNPLPGAQTRGAVNAPRP